MSSYKPSHQIVMMVQLVGCHITDLYHLGSDLSVISV